MKREELVLQVALVIAEANQPGLMYVAERPPTGHVMQEANRIVSMVQEVTLENRRARVTRYLEECKAQAEDLFVATEHPMWLGKSLAFGEIIEAIKYGVLGVEYDEQ